MSQPFSPSFPGENTDLPWAPTTISQTIAAVPESDVLECVRACVKGVDAGISPGNGTSGTARIRNAVVSCTAGKPRVGKRDGVAILG